MTRSFIEKNSADPIRNQENANSSSLLTESLHLKTNKSQKTQNNQQSNESNISNQIPKICTVNNNRIPHAAQTEITSKKANPSQSYWSKNVMIGTPTKNKIVQREKSVVSKEVSSNTVPLKNSHILDENISSTSKFSPRKTRSKTVKNKNETIVNHLKDKTKIKLSQLDGAHDEISRRTKSKTNAKSHSKPDDSSNSDSDFEPSPPKRIRTRQIPHKPENKALSKAKQIDRRVFSTDGEIETDSNKNHISFWVEAYAEKEKKWMVIEPIKNKVDCVDHIRVSIIGHLFYWWHLS